MAGVMRIGAGLVGLKSENMHATAARSKIQRGPATPAERTVERAGVLLGSLWGCFAGTLGSLCALWVYFGYIGATL